MMTRKQAEDYVYQSYLSAGKYQDYASKDAEKRHPEYSRDIIRGLASAPTVLVTGSKGKGSVANIVATVVSSCRKVGMMTSPHLTDFCERFKVNGIDISDDDFCKYMDEIRPSFDDVQEKIPVETCVSPMGIQAALALSYFKSKGTELNVMECGKGARYDDVNNAVHEYAIINTIFLEHTRELGSTCVQIAEDKSHIITGEQRCVYVAMQQSDVMNVISERALRFDTPMKIYGKDFFSTNIRYTMHGMLFDVVIGKDTYRDILLPLMGEHQAHNCALAIAFCKDFLADDFDIEVARQCIATIKWAGRMEILSSSPFVLLDACINKGSCINVINVLKYLGIDRCCVIIGIPDDKDFMGVAQEMQCLAGNMIMTKSQNAHYVFTDMQIERLSAVGVKASWADDIDTAFSMSESMNLPVVALGTTSFVSEVRERYSIPCDTAKDSCPRSL